MEGVANFWNSFWGGVPDVIMAVIMLVLAFLVAWLAKYLIVKLVKAVGLERGMAKAGTSKENIKKTVGFLGKLTYLVVFLLFVPGIFDKLGMNSTSTPLVEMMNKFVAYLPHLVGGFVVIIVGLFIAKVVKELLTPVLNKMKVNEWAAKIGIDTKKVNIADILATTVYVLIAVLFAVEAINALQLATLTKIGDAIIAYLPSVLAAVIVLLIAFLLGSWVESALVKKFSVSKFTAVAAKAAIIVTGGFMALSQLGVASVLVNGTYIMVVGALAVAFAVAFGMGGKDFAAHTMRKLEQKLDSKPKKK